MPTVQTIDQIIGAISDQFQAQELGVQWEIQKQVQTMNAQFVTLAEQMQQLISTTTAATTVGNNPPTPRPLPVTSRFHGKEWHYIYITNDTFQETEPTLAYSRPPVRIKLKAQSMDTLYNNKFSHTTLGKDDIPCATPMGHPPPMAHPFGFSDYLPNNYYGHPQPQFDPPCMSH
uniref:Uncharacterized protein n=1 Tax=Romanomermis culicivorax TaxID=13658 RepID=A0A915IRA2_ROMCU